MYDVIFSSFLVPFTINTLSECAHNIYSVHGGAEDRAFRKAIIRSVDGVQDSLKDGLKKAITKDIQDACEKVEKADIDHIVTREFAQWGEYLVDPHNVAHQICINLIHEIDGIPGLRDKIAYQQVYQIREILEKHVDSSDRDYKKIMQTLDRIANEHNQGYKCMLEILEILKSNTKDTSDSIINSQYIPDEYKDFFHNELFLENRMPDKERVHLKDVYIPNTFRILDFPFANSNKDYDDLLQFIEDFLKSKLNTEKYNTKYSNDPKFINVLFIKGLPGSGKSSLFYFLANKKAYDPSFFPNHRFYFIKLISVYNALNRKLSIDNPLDDIEQYLGPTHSINKKTVIILDGLDEICVAKDLDIQVYCNNLIDSATSRNLKIIITTRLNYINISHTDNKNVFNVQLVNLSVDQLEQWSDKYFSIHHLLIDERKRAKKNIDYMKKHPQDLLVDIFAVPLLFYMIVVTKIDISRVKNIGELYDNVFAELQTRNYDEADEDIMQKPRISKKIPVKLARTIAVEISYKMYETNQLLLKTHSNELMEALNTAESTIYDIKEEDKKDIERLFPMTFYYKDSVDVVEFAHKSIMEFFAAEKLYRSILEYKNRFDSYVSDYIVNPIIITYEVLNFFSYFASKKENSGKLNEIFPDFVMIFKKMVYEKQAFSNINITYPFETTIVVFKYYWYFLRNILNENVARINLVIDDEIIKRFIVCTLSMIDSNSIPFLDNAVIPYDFSGLCFNEYHFAHCHLDYCSFDNSEMNNCLFYYSDLMGTSMQNLMITDEITFSSCNLTGIIISNWKQLIKEKTNEKKTHKKAKAIFTGCVLNDATIQDMNLTEMTIRSIVEMSGAIIQQTQMKLEQFIYFLRFSVSFMKIEIILTTEDLVNISSSDLEKARKEPESKETIMSICQSHLPSDIDLISRMNESLEQVKIVFP